MPAIHRDGDSRTCGAVTVVDGQSTFFVNGKLASVDDDPNSHGSGNLVVQSGTFYIEGILASVNGTIANADSLCIPLGGAHCGPNANSGSPDFFIDNL